ncbi:MAG: DUF6691 family protein [Myxococcota bacterium]
MNHPRRRTAIAALSGGLFGVGLVVSGMTRPDKVVGFLDVGGDWDPSLAFVMGGAAAVYVAVHWGLARVRSRPVFASAFRLPARTSIDAQLGLGASLFGIGWGLSGYCPGPALASIGTGSTDVLVFVATMLVGMVLGARLRPGRTGGSKQRGITASSAGP